MLRRLWKEKWFYLIFGTLAVVMFGSMYVHFEIEDADKPTWFAAVTDAVVHVIADWRYSMPDCDDTETIQQVEDLARHLVLTAMPHNIEQPFHLDKIELVAITEQDAGGEGQVCRGYLEAPNLARPGQTYPVGVISYSILDDETKPGWYIIEAELGSVNLRQWAE